MSKTNKRETGRAIRRARVRRKVQGTTERPRLCVFRSLRYTYAQVIEDVSGQVLFSASSRGKPGEKGAGSVDTAKKVGLKIAEMAKERKIEQVVFDRNGYVYHGRVAAVAEGAREGGLDF